ncbi:hypothetical protein J2S74_001570 [Evansella vedderi]|uniref:Uncharacterized protein n=1 Tax=Evansella vedderi TaxID=38282 RepID=A0ABT9ZTD1_9BACI|nr:DUF5342 family protein [Evansella vedderi]MDQ0254195.1 hypothetical protein [Evansella vedderi]
MLTHFHYKEIKNNLINQEWSFSFYYKQKKYLGNYYKDGTIKWDNPSPKEEDKKFLETCVHDLMLFHVYEKH